MKGIEVLFQMIYGSPDSYKKWLDDRSNNQASLVDPGEYQNMIIKYLSVGLQSWFLYQQVALNLLFQMRYDSLPNSEKQPCDSQRGWSNSCFHISPVLFLLPASKHASPIWSLTQSLLGADEATISHLKEEILSIMGYKNFETFW